MKTFALVVEWQVADDADTHGALDALVRNIHANSPTAADNVTAYVGVSAELIAEAARVGAVVSQADRLHLEPGDVVTVRLRADQVDDPVEIGEIVKAAFPDHQVMVVRDDVVVDTTRG